MMKKTIFLATAISLLTSIAQANESTATLDFQVNVQPYCETEVGQEMNFGTLSTFTSTVAYNTVTVKCTKTTQYSIEIEAGQSSVSDTSRFLATNDGENKLEYHLYQNWNGSTGKTWGTEMSGNSKKGYATGNAEKHQITGVITQDQVFSNLAGDYSETVRVTVKY